VWDLITPQEAIAVRGGGPGSVVAAAAGRPGGRGGKAAGLLWRAVEDLDFAGRVLAAANAELAAYVGQHRPNVAEANATTKSSCAAVSSAREPRAARTAAMAASGGIPTATR
jgi:Helix-turn-helix family